MKIQVPGIKYQAEIPERDRIFIQDLYESVWGDSALLAVGTKRGQAHIISVTEKFDHVKYRTLFSKPQDWKLFLNVTDIELIKSGWVLLYTSQHEFAIDFAYPLDVYLARTADTLHRQMRKMGAHFDAVSMHLLGDIFYQVVAMAMSKATGTICEYARSYTAEQMQTVLPQKISEYEISILRMYSEYPECGIPVSDARYQYLFVLIDNMVREISDVKT